MKVVNKALLAVLTGAAVLLSLPLMAQHRGEPAKAAAADDRKATGTPTDEGFARGASGAYQMGSKLAMITATRATDPGLKTLGSNLVKDFIRMGSQLKPAVSGEKGYQWSDKPAPEDQHTLDGLDRLSGGELDAALRRQLVALMERMDAVFSTEAAKGSDADLKPFAQRSAPWIKERLKQARSLDHQQD